MATKGQQVILAIIGEPVSALDPGQLVVEMDVLRLWAWKEWYAPKVVTEKPKAKSPKSPKSPNYTICEAVGEILIDHWKTVNPSATLKNRNVTQKVEVIVGKANELTFLFLV